MVLNQISLRLSQIGSFITETKTPVPLILDLLKISSNTFVAENKQGCKIEIRPGTGERFAFYENLIRSDYLNNGATLKDGDTVIDIGANIGCFTVMAASIVGNSGRVIAIEPNPETYQQLCRNIELNNLSNVTPLNLAIGANNQPIELYISDNSLYSSFYAKVDKHQIIGKKIAVNSETLESLMEQLKIQEVQLLKLDCEGAEYQILDSISPSLASRIKQVSMEVHEISEREPQEIQDKLSNLGFQVKVQYPLYAWR